MPHGETQGRSVWEPCGDNVAFMETPFGRIYRSHTGAIVFVPDFEVFADKLASKIKAAILEAVNDGEEKAKASLKAAQEEREKRLAEFGRYDPSPLDQAKLDERSLASFESRQGELFDPPLGLHDADEVTT